MPCAGFCVAPYVTTPFDFWLLRFGQLSNHKMSSLLELPHIPSPMQNALLLADEQLHFAATPPMYYGVASNLGWGPPPTSAILTSHQPMPTPLTPRPTHSRSSSLSSSGPYSYSFKYDQPPLQSHTTMRCPHVSPSPMSNGRRRI